MASSKRPKLLLELELHASGQQEASDRVDPKRQRTGLGCAGDDFEEFVALLDRIQYTKIKQADLGDLHVKSMAAEDLDVKVSKTKSPWIPSFEMEDFYISAAKDTISPQTDICSPSGNENPSNSEDKGKRSIQPANHLKTTTSFSRTAYDNRPSESFDLNVEASSEDNRI